MAPSWWVVVMFTMRKYKEAKDNLLQTLITQFG